MKGKIEKINALLKNKEISPSLLLEKYLERIKEKEELNAFITVTEKEALENTRYAERLFDEGKDTLLSGIPMSLKDNLSSCGILTTAGSRVLSDYYPAYDAHTYACLKKEGAVLLGKNNMDEFGMGASSDTSFKGVVINPLDEKRSPGGSSGGSAAAVASGEVVYSLGSDTGGSIRLPASYTGTVGLCPTYGALSRRGLIAHSSLLDRVGIIAGSVSDVSAVFDAVNCFDEKDMTSVKGDRKKTYGNLSDGVKGLKVGIILDVTDKAHDETKKHIKRAAETYRLLGAEVSDVKIPAWDKADDIYSVIATSDAASNLARYDGVRYGERGNSVVDTREGFGDEVRMRILLGNAILTSEKELSLRKKAEAERCRLAESFKEVFGRFDILISPSAFHTAPLLGETDELLTDYFLTAASVSHLPSLSMPVGFSENGLHLGMLITAKWMNEDVILRAAYAFEDAMQGEIYKKGAEKFEF